MAVFHYRFERILNIKKHLEDEKRQELALIQAEIERQYEKIRQLDEEERARRQEINKLQTGKIDLTAIRQVKQFILIIEKRKEMIRGEIAALKQMQEKKRNELMEAMKERKKYERLKERRYKAFLYMENVREQYEQDEMGQNLFIYRRNINE